MPHFDARNVILCAGVVDPYLPGGTEGATHTYRPGERLEGLPSEWAPMMHELGVGMMQIDLPHVTTYEKSEGVWDWEKMDAWVRQCRDLGFQVMLFPHWHWPPTWYIRKYGLTGIRCLEHDEALPCFSPWDPATRPWFDRCTAALASHTHETGGAPEGFFIGVFGDYGECMYPLGQAEELADRFQFERGETVDHCHADFWCGDRFARADFPQRMVAKHGSLDAMNRAWQTSYDQPGEIVFPREGRCARRAWLDFIAWYMGAMTAFSADVAAIYRRHFPEAVLTVPLGGGVEPVRIGQDNTALAKAMVASRTAVRSTANTCTYRSTEFGPVEKYARSYAIVKRIKSACRHYAAAMWLEPPYPPNRDAVSVTAGVFEALACGVMGCLDWGRTFDRQQDRYLALKGLLRGIDPLIDTAVYFPTTSHRLTLNGAKYWGNMPARFWDGCSALRPCRDYDVVDDLLVADGALASYKWLLIFEADIIEQATLEAVDAWIRQGGIAIVAATPMMETVEGETGPWRDLLGLSIDADHVTASGEISCMSDPALSSVAAASFNAVPSGWRGLGLATAPLVTCGEVAVAWRHDLGQGAVYALSEGAEQLPLMLEFYQSICSKGVPLPGSVDLCRSAEQAQSVWVTAFHDRVAVLNLNEEEVALKEGWGRETIPALDITCLDKAR